MVDLFIYRDPEEIEKEEEAAADAYAFQNQGGVATDQLAVRRAKPAI